MHLPATVAPSFQAMPSDLVAVKNVSRGPLPVDPLGMLEPGETGHADDNDHLRALIDAGSLLEMPAKAKATPKTDRGEE